MKRIALCLATLVIPVAAFAQDDPAASINVLLTPPSYSGCGDPAFNFIDAGSCADLSSSGTGGQGFLWVVLSREGGFSGVGGCQFGLNHTVAASGWTLCTGGSEVPEGGWPASGTGNAVTWGGGCYVSPGSNAKIGFLAVNPDNGGSIAITADPRVGSSVWADCDAALWTVCEQYLGSDDLASGTSPSCGDASATGCTATPIEETTWGGIKSLF
jgi:hypothetical protein